MITAAGGERFLDALMPMVLPAIQIDPEPTTDDEIRVGASKFGGEPDLPGDFTWPVTPTGPMNFLAQINLAEVPDCDDDRAMPGEGLISFFYRVSDGVWGFSPDDRSGFLVHYTPPGVALARRAAPLKVDACDEEFVFTPCSLSFQEIASLPSATAVLDDHNPPNEDDWIPFIEDNTELEMQLWGPQGSDGTFLHQMLGRPFTVQTPFVLIEAAAIMRGIDLSGENPETDEEAWNQAVAEHVDWVVLLQLDSDDRPGWMWGDMGVLFFMVHKDALSRADFSNAWCILQCG